MNMNTQNNKFNAKESFEESVKQINNMRKNKTHVTTWDNFVKKIKYRK